MTITVTFTGTLGATSSDSIEFLLTNHITVVGWIDVSAISLPSAPPAPVFPGDLATAVGCGIHLGAWDTAGAIGVRNAGLGSFLFPPLTDVPWINAWLNVEFANLRPSSTITGQSVSSRGGSLADFIARLLRLSNPNI